MPVTKTAKRALRVSRRKEEVNTVIRTRLETAIRIAKKKGGRKNILTAISLVDRASKRNVIHQNKAARIKSTLSKLLLQAKSRSASVAKNKSKKRA